MGEMSNDYPAASRSAVMLFVLKYFQKSFLIL